MTISEYIKGSQNLNVGGIPLKLEGVNYGDVYSINEPTHYDDGEYYTFIERMDKALDEFKTETKGMNMMEAQTFFKGHTEQGNANYYGNWFYIYTLSFNPEYLLFGIRMD